MYPFRKLSAHAARILESLLCGYSFGLQQSWKELSVERQYLSVTGA